mmetsp:Transcript_6742/g.9392  ORF Transcript_6742/g.9392 Transcript_6742/m.9392 type:complete len:84 (+) Transcript_6742:166-417(+)
MSPTAIAWRRDWLWLLQQSEHNMKMISSLRHASNYANWYLHDKAPSKTFAKTIGFLGKVVAKASSAYDKSGLVSKTKTKSLLT